MSPRMLLRRLATIAPAVVLVAPLSPALSSVLPVAHDPTSARSPLEVASRGCLTHCVIKEPRSTGPAPTVRRAARAHREPVVDTVRDAFGLHSRPGADLTVFLDFDGAPLDRTQWAELKNAPRPSVAEPFDVNGDPRSFSTTERVVVEHVWREVAEDFAAFDVDVTTQDPGAAALARTTVSDTVYGTTVLVTGDNWVTRWCGGCAGVATTNAFSKVGNDAYRTALVFPDYLVSAAKGLLDPVRLARVVGTFASHEVGHHLGLDHDGLNGKSPRGWLPYHPGKGVWGPIMGAPTTPMTRWSDGSYEFADNKQDDLAILAGHLGIVPDEPPLLPLTRDRPTSAVISSATDVDTFVLAPRRTTRVLVDVAGTAANLDLAVDVSDGTNPLRTHAPATRVLSGLLDGLGVSFSLTPGRTYTIAVRPDSTPGVENVYGSLGRYTVRVIE